MKKIPSVFVRDMETKKFTTVITPGCEWVLAGEGVATKKYDGTPCMIEDGFIYKRYDAKHGKTPPADFRPCQQPDAITGHWPGWVPCETDDPSNKYIFEAFKNHAGYSYDFENGTYELCGPKINGNREKLICHALLKHGAVQFEGTFPRTFESIREDLSKWGSGNEGLVYHHPDGRMAKVKYKDFSWV